MRDSNCPLILRISSRALLLMLSMCGSCICGRALLGEISNWQFLKGIYVAVSSRSLAIIHTVFLSFLTRSFLSVFYQEDPDIISPKQMDNTYMYKTHLLFYFIFWDPAASAVDQVIKRWWSHWLLLLEFQGYMKQPVIKRTIISHSTF